MEHKLAAVQLGRDLLGEEVDEATIDKGSVTLPATVRVVPASDAVMTETQLVYAVRIENHGEAPATIYLARSLTRPSAAFLRLTLGGPGIATLGLEGAESHKVERVTLPPATAARVIASLVLQAYKYTGAPPAQLDWALHLYPDEVRGVVQVLLPHRDE